MQMGALIKCAVNVDGPTERTRSKCELNSINAKVSLFGEAVQV